jgi:hypothetical protein
MRSASRTSVVRMWPARCQPTIALLSASTTKKHRRVGITLEVQLDRLEEGVVHRLQYKTQATLLR